MSEKYSTGNASYTYYTGSREFDHVLYSGVSSDGKNIPWPVQEGSVNN
ncbi:hypothetical protein FACS189459_7310 [Bacilli bacterium]|nr:hypothetical protein FACS189459_7310 [Bacilli bacterium]